MKKLFLASSICDTAKAIAKDIGLKNSKVLFITTASEIERGPLDWQNDDKNGLVNAGFKVSEFTFTGKTKDEIENAIKENDIVHINGGNTFYLLEKMRQSGADKIIKNAVENGKIFTGSSAGSIIAGPDIYPARIGDDMSVAPNLTNYKGLELVDFVVFPHWGSEFFKVAYENKTIEHTYNSEHKMILLNDYQYVKVIDDMYKIEEIPHK